MASVRRHAHPEAVEAEWRAQVERAQKADEYELFGTDGWRRWLDDQPFALTGMRELRDSWLNRSS